MNLLPPADRPSFPSDSDRLLYCRRVNILHPHLPVHNHLLSFTTADRSGVCYDLVYYAACIIAGNIYHPDEGLNESNADEPFLSRSRSREDPRLRPENGVIPPGEYYFLVKDSSNEDPYPFVPNFSSWVFPGSAPGPWASLRPPPNAPNPEPFYNDSDGPCRVTMAYNGIESCHVIPQNARKWYTVNKMSDCPAYITNTDAIHDRSNRAAIRKDIHHLFDHNHIIFFPKRDANDHNRHKLACHVLVPPGGVNGNQHMEALALYQNRTCLPFRHVSVEFLFVRFAWSLFTNHIIPIYAGAAATHVFRVFAPVKRDGRRFSIVEDRMVKDLPTLRSLATGIKGGPPDPVEREGGPTAEDDIEHIYSLRRERVLDVDEAGDPAKPLDIAADEYDSDWSESGRLSPCSTGRKRSREWDAEQEEEEEEEVEDFEPELVYSARGEKMVRLDASGMPLEPLDGVDAYRGPEADSDCDSDCSHRSKRSKSSSSDDESAGHNRNGVDDDNDSKPTLYSRFRVTSPPFRPKPASNLSDHDLARKKEAYENLRRRTWHPRLLHHSSSSSED